MYRRYSENIKQQIKMKNLYQMKRQILTFGIAIAVTLFFFSGLHAQKPATSAGFNYSSFTTEKKTVTSELQSLTDKQFYAHPEYGVLPYNAPCTDCIELLQKRDETHRYFVKQGTNGKEFYAQTSYSHLNYRDANGALRTIDKRIKTTEQQGIYTADHQYTPVKLNMPEKYSSILNAGKEFQFNRNVSIFIMHQDGSTTSLGEPDWSNYTAGDDGAVVHNLYPGIDLEMQVGNGHIESFYRLNKPLYLSDGWLVIRDNMKVPQELVYDFSYSEKLENNFYEGTLFINDKAGTHYFYIGAPAAYDENNEHDNAINLNYQIADNGVYDLYVPIEWMNDAKRSYPLVIDPFVSAISEVPQASITGSGYNATCFQNGCSYHLNVEVPAACCVYDLHYSFNYRALGSCNLGQAAWDLTYDTCKSPTPKGAWHTCTVPIPGLCILQDLSCYYDRRLDGTWLEDMKECIPPPQCNPYSMPFTLNFYRCVAPGSGDGCGFSCITADTPWDMTVYGKTLSIDSVHTSTSSTEICMGDSVTLTASTKICAPPAPIYVSWYPGGLTGDPVNVSPTTTTTYTVIATNCAGADSAQATVLITVSPNDNPGFVISQDSVCANTPIAISGLGAAPATSYNWTLTGGTPATVNSVQNFNVSYANAGNYNVIFNWTSPNSGCVFNDTQQVTIESCVGIFESYLSNLVSLYPNPANNQLTLSSSFIHANEAVTVSITNLLGEIMREEKKKWSNETNINISTLPAGMYFLQMKTESAIDTKRFIKE